MSYHANDITRPLFITVLARHGLKRDTVEWVPIYIYENPSAITRAIRAEAKYHNNASCMARVYRIDFNPRDVTQLKDNMECIWHGPIDQFPGMTKSGEVKDDKH